MYAAWKSPRERLEADVDGAALGAFRIVLACQVLWDVAWLAATGGITERFFEPEFYFKYPYFEFVQPPTGLVPYVFFGAIAAAGMAVLVGWHTRISTKLLCAGVLYWFLIDAAHYSDHGYLVCVASVFAAWLPVNRWMSSDRWVGREPRQTVPFWTLLLTRLQVFLVFFFSPLFVDILVRWRSTKDVF